MSPEFDRELCDLDEADAARVLSIAMSRIGKDDTTPGPVKARAIQQLLQTFLRTGFPEQAAQVLREMRGDIDLRLQIMDRMSA